MRTPFRFERREFFGWAMTGIILGVAGIRASRADTIYVSTFSSSKIEQFTVSGVETTFAADPGGSQVVSGPTGLAFDASGNLYVANTNPFIEKFTPLAVPSRFANSNLSNPGALAFDAAGNLFVANAGNNTIVKFDANGAGAVFATPATGANGPNGLAFDGKGNLFVSNAGNNTIEKFTPSGVGSVFASSGISAPTGLAFDQVGNLFVANFGNDTIEKFTPGGVGTLFANTRPNSPLGLAFDSSNNLYVTFPLNNSIERFATDGSSTVFASAGLLGPQFIVVQTPEPATLSMLMLALLLITVRQQGPRAVLRTMSA